MRSPSTMARQCAYSSKTSISNLRESLPTVPPPISTWVIKQSYINLKFLAASGRWCLYHLAIRVKIASFTHQPEAREHCSLQPLR